MSEYTSERPIDSATNLNLIRDQQGNYEVEADHGYRR